MIDFSFSSPFKRFLFIYFWLHWALVAGLPLVAASRDCSLVALHRLLIAEASLVAELGL